MPTGTEMDILKFIDMEGGETRMGAIKRLLGCYGSSYVETICGSLGRHDFIDWLKDGTVKLTSKGWKAVGKLPPEEEMLKQWMERAPEAPEEKYKRWMGNAGQEAPLTVESVLKRARSRRTSAKNK